MRHIIWLLCGFLFACGGSSGGDSDTGFTADFKDESLFVNRCEAPRNGLNPETNLAWPDRQGSVTDQNNWLRSWMNDKYFWYDQIVDRDPSLYSTDNYFDLMKKDPKTASGEQRDKFSFSLATEDYQNNQAGLNVSMGIRWQINSRTPPRDFKVVYVEPNSPADKAGIKRGDRITSIDGVDFINDNTQSGVNKLNAALSPQSVGKTHIFTFNDINTYVLTSETVENSPVLKTDVISTNTGKVGYIVFNTHIPKAEDQLVSAFNQLKSEDVNDLVLDLRYNGGGRIYIASQIAYMIAGPNNTRNKTFYSQVFNDKHPLFDPFSNRPLVEFEFLPIKIDDVNFTLPSLGLNRVFILTGKNTCSASELIMNSLRGIDIEVIQIGESTCGKPFGFRPVDNCGTTYLAVNFQGVNAKGFGDYDISGFTPSTVDNGKDNIRGCEVYDDIDNQLGDPTEARLAEALYFRQNNSCSGLRSSASGNNPFSSGLTGQTDIDTGVLYPPAFNAMMP